MSLTDVTSIDLDAAILDLLKRDVFERIGPLQG